MDSKCAKCGKHNFEAVTQEIADYKRRVTFVQCAHCGVVVGVLPGEAFMEQFADMQRRIRKLTT